MILAHLMTYTTPDGDYRLKMKRAASPDYFFTRLFLHCYMVSHYAPHDKQQVKSTVLLVLTYKLQSGTCTDPSGGALFSFFSFIYTITELALPSYCILWTI